MRVDRGGWIPRRNAAVRPTWWPDWSTPPFMNRWESHVRLHQSRGELEGIKSPPSHFWLGGDLIPSNPPLDWCNRTSPYLSSLYPPWCVRDLGFGQVATWAGAEPGLWYKGGQSIHQYYPIKKYCIILSSLSTQHEIRILDLYRLF
jgi:hypothetical protein